MAQNALSAETGLQNRITLMEDLLKKVVEVHLSTAVHVKSLDEKFSKMELTSATLTKLVRKVEGLADGEQMVSSTRSIMTDEMKSGLADLRKDVAELQQMMAKLLEKSGDGQLVASAPMVEKLDALSQVPDLFDKFQSQQSTILQTLEKRIDPRLMIYLKPLIEMLEEEGLQAEVMKNNALQQLNDVLTGNSSGTNREISETLQNVSKEIEKCQAAFERTQQALQIVVTPFQNIGQLFRGNLETIVQAHDLMAQLHEDFPKFLEEMRRMHQVHAQQVERMKQMELMKHMEHLEQLKQMEQTIQGDKLNG
ncbi:MAG: hypothetical protein HQL91_01975 [Magnetococcales bacterium]|nr:hypothetical protein [Magnetococcales bacterium]